MGDLTLNEASEVAGNGPLNASSKPGGETGHFGAAARPFDGLVEEEGGEGTAPSNGNDHQHTNGNGLPANSTAATAGSQNGLKSSSSAVGALSC